MALSKIVNVGFQLMFLACAGPLFACSVPMWLGPGPGPEMASSFTVALHREGRPLVGAKITLAGEGKEHVVETGPDGTFRFSGLASGDYRLSAQYLGLSVAWQCFHIRDNPSSKALGSVTYPWVPFFHEVRKIQGRISDPNKWLSTLQIELRDVLTRRAVAGVKTDDGRFTFAGIPEGGYVLSIVEDGMKSNHLVRLNSAAARMALNFTVDDTTCGPTIRLAR